MNELGNAPHGWARLTCTESGSTTSVPVTIDPSAMAPNGPPTNASMFFFTEAASNGSPFWYVTFGRRLIKHESKFSLAIHDSASQGLAPLSGPISARGSSTDEPTKLPASA